MNMSRSTTIVIARSELRTIPFTTTPTEYLLLASYAGAATPHNHETLTNASRTTCRTSQLGTNCHIAFPANTASPSPPVGRHVSRRSIGCTGTGSPGGGIGVGTDQWVCPVLRSFAVYLTTRNLCFHKI